MQKRASGFSDLLRSGSPIAQHYQDALGKLVGRQNALQATLQLTGTNLQEAHQNIDATTAAWNKGGGAVKGFDDVTKTFNFKLSQMKEQFHIVAIDIGTYLIPKLQALASFFANHMEITKFGLALVAAFLGLSVVVKVVSTLHEVYKGIKAVTLAVKEWELATKLLTIAQWAWNVASKANFLGLIIIGIVALVAAFVYCWTHFKGFREFWITAWKDIQAAAMATWHFLEAVWNGIIAGAKFLWDYGIKFYFELAMLEFKIVATVAMWLLHNIFEPVFHGIAGWAQWWWGNVQEVFKQFMRIVRDVGDLIMWWWHNVTEPAFQAVANVVLWWWHTIMEPAFKAAGQVITWWWDSIVKPAFDLFMSGVHLGGDVVSWFWHTIIEPAFNAISDVVHRAIDLVVGYFHWWVDTAKSVLGWFGNLATMFWNWFVGAYNSSVKAVGMLISFVASIPRRVIDALGNMADLLVRAGSAVIEGFVNGIKSALSGLYNTVGGIASWISTHKGPIDRDRMLLHPHGRAIIQGLIHGIRSCLPDLWKLVGGIADGIQQAATGTPAVTFTTVSKWVTDAVPSLQYASSGAGYATAYNRHLVTTQVPVTPPPGAVTPATGAGLRTQPGHTPHVTIHVHGHVSTQRDLETAMQQAFLRMNVRNPTNQLSLPTGR
jgi:phage-related protein